MALDISPEAVRNRLSRGTLNSEKEDGTVYVLLPAHKMRHVDGRSRYTADNQDGIYRNISVHRSISTIHLTIYWQITPRLYPRN